VEYRVFLIFDSFQHPIECSADQGAGDVNVHARADAERTAAPAGVDQVHPAPVAAHPLAQHRGIDARKTRHERLAEKAGEGADRIDDAGLGAASLLV